MPSFNTENVLSSVQYIITAENYTYVLRDIFDRWRIFCQIFLHEFLYKSAGHKLVSVFYTSKSPFLLFSTYLLFSKQK
jgi:hypothetical protein